MLKVKKLVNNSKLKEIERAAELLKNGELVAIPTETVYGLAGNAFSEKAIESIYETKNRPPINPLIVHVKNVGAINEIAQNIPENAFKLADAFWPGPLTLILEKQNHISSLITANKNTVGIRVPNHEVTLKLLESLDFPLVAPSANRSNHISPTSPEHVVASLGEKSPYILDGGVCEKGIESTIVGFIGDEVVIYRYGALPKEKIEKVLNCKVIEVQNHITPQSPGMFKKHYSPNTPLVLTKDVKSEIIKYSQMNVGVIGFQNSFGTFPQLHHKILSPSGKLSEAAYELYSTLHEFDELNLDLIIVEEVPNRGIGVAINDRLRRASHN